MEANYTIVNYDTYKHSTVIEVMNLPACNMVVNMPRISKAVFLNKEQRAKETLIKGYWKIKNLKK